MNRALLVTLVTFASCQRCDAPKASNTHSDSPSGIHSAGVITNVNEVGGITQVIVAFASSGGGVFTIDQADVPLRLRWVDDAQLIISYPRELKPSWHRERIQSFDDVVTVRIEPYDGAVFPTKKTQPLKATVIDAGTLRGRVVNVEGRFRYEYFDVNEPDSSAAWLQAKGFQGGGPSWAGIVHGLVKLKRPELFDALEFDEEADGLVIWSTNRDALFAVARLVTDVKTDETLMKKAIEVANADDVME